MSWHIQYQGRMTTRDAAVHNLDGEGTSSSQVEALHAAGAHVVCYVNAGAAEDFRDDVDAFPVDVLGGPLDNWPGERWLDVRALDVLLPIMAARMDACHRKGFDAALCPRARGVQRAEDSSWGSWETIPCALAFASPKHMTVFPLKNRGFCTPA